jgi:hypothetical protein
LDALEREEEDFVEQLRTQVLPAAPQPIGVAGGSEESKKAATATPDVDLTAIPALPLFWNKHRHDVDTLRHAREGRDPRPSSIHTGRMSLDSLDRGGEPSFSLDTPTSRTG